jgi:hypothetical protein
MMDLWQVVQALLDQHSSEDIKLVDLCFATNKASQVVTPEEAAAFVGSKGARG